jgi:hypothetical protein
VTYPPFRSARILAPLVALLALALLALVLAAQAGLAFCGNRVAVPLPQMNDMPGMSMVSMPGMTSGHALMICPVVLVLIVASGLLAAAAIVAVCADGERALTRRILVRLIARLPVAPVLLVVGGGAALAVAAMIAVDGAGVPSLATCSLLVALLLGGALVSVVAAMLGAQIVLALGQRLLIALIGPIAARREQRRAGGLCSAPPAHARGSLRLLSTGLGLRAPPSFVR